MLLPKVTIFIPGPCWFFKVFEAYEERIVELLTEPVEAWNQYSSAISMETAIHDPEIGFDPLNSAPADEKSELQNEVLNEDVVMSMETFGLEIPKKDSDPDRLLGRVDEVPHRSDARLPSDDDDVAGSEFAPKDTERDRIDDEEEEKLSKDLIAAILMEEEQEQEQEEEDDEQRKDANNSSSSEGIPGPEPSASGVDVGLMNRNRGRPKTLEELGYVRVTVEEKQAIDRVSEKKNILLNYRYSRLKLTNVMYCKGPSIYYQ